MTMSDIKELTCLEKLKLALKYSVSQKHKQSLIKRINAEELKAQQSFL
jgi:hypothetical protein